MKISVGIVTYNNENEIKRVLRSFSECSVEGLKVYVADNASTDRTKQIIKTAFPTVSLIPLKKNIGFGAANNRIISLIDSDYHIIVNPDITFEKSEIDDMVAYMNKNPDVAILSPKILNPDGTVQYVPRCNPKLKYIISGKLENKGHLFYSWRSEYTLRDKEISKPLEIESCTGCFMLCKTEILKKCNGFDEKFFLYCEDADLTRRMKKYGKTVLYPDACVIHEWKRASNKNFIAMIHHIKSFFKYWKKWRNDGTE